MERRAALARGGEVIEIHEGVGKVGVIVRLEADRGIAQEVQDTHLLTAGRETGKKKKKRPAHLEIHTTNTIQYNPVQYNTHNKS